MLFAGLALVLANAYYDVAKGKGWGEVGSEWKLFGAEAAAVLAGTWVADRYEGGGTAVLALLGFLWLLFAMHTWGFLGAKAAAPASTETAPPVVGPSSGPAKVRKLA